MSFLTIIPPIISVILSLITKEVIPSLFLGLVSGIVVHMSITGINFIEAIKLIINIISSAISDNSQTILFTSILGGLSRILLNSGSTILYADWLQKKIKSKKLLQLVAVGLSFLLSIDDYFNCLTIGTIMKPIAVKYKISKAKIAYILDSLSAPVCILMPISSWAASIISCFKNSEFNAMEIFIKTISCNFYCIFTIFFLILIIFSSKDFGKMLKIENIASKGKDITSDDIILENIEKNKNAKLLNLILPILVIIIISIFMIFETGGFFLGLNKNNNISYILSNSNSTLSITIGALSAIIVSFFLLILNKTLPFKKIISSFSDGVKSMISSFILLTLVWSMSILCKNILMTDIYIGSIISTSNFPMNLFPLIIFITSSVLSFSIGSSWGTFGILIPICVSTLSQVNPELIVYSVSAILSGSIFGTHCSPISDNTIMASAGSGCKHMEHVTTQIPYSLCAAFAAAIGFFIIGITKSLFFSIIIPIFLMILFFVFLNKDENFNKIKCISKLK